MYVHISKGKKISRFSIANSQWIWPRCAGGAWDIIDNDTIDTKSIEKVSNFIFHLMQFWKALRKEQIRPDFSKKADTHFSMHQFRNLFNTVRIPKVLTIYSYGL